MAWNITKPRKRRKNPITLRYQQGDGPKQQGQFVWSDVEDAWVELCDHPDGIALYPDDGWKVLGWK